MLSAVGAAPCVLQALSPQAYFVRKNKFTGLPGSSMLDFLTDKQALSAYSNLPPIVCILPADSNKKRRLGDKPFIKTWMADENIRTYDRVDFIPPPRRCPDGVFNSFHGFPAASLPASSPDDGGASSSESQPAATAQPFRDHLRLMLGDEIAAYVEKWLAWIVQRPGTPTGVILVLIGQQGCGKNWVLENVMGRILGAEYYFRTESPKDQLFDRFGEARRHKVLVYIDDCNVGEIKMHSEQLKSLITAENISYQIKNGPTITQANCANYAMGTNKDHPVTVEAGGRREFVVKCKAEGALDFKNTAEHMAYFTQLFALINNPAFIREVYDFLINVDLTGVSLQHDRPATAVLHDLKGLSASPILHFLEATVTRENAATVGVHGRNNTLWSSYKEWAPQHGWKEEQIGNSIKFANCVKGIPGVVYTPSSKTGGNGNKIVFDFDKLQEHLRLAGVVEEEEPTGEVEEGEGRPGGREADDEAHRGEASTGVVQ